VCFTHQLAVACIHRLLDLLGSGLMCVVRLFFESSSCEGKRPESSEDILLNADKEVQLQAGGNS